MGITTLREPVILCTTHLRPRDWFFGGMASAYLSRDLYSINYVVLEKCDKRHPYLCWVHDSDFTLADTLHCPIRSFPNINSSHLPLLPLLRTSLFQSVHHRVHHSIGKPLCYINGIQRACLLGYGADPKPSRLSACGRFPESRCSNDWSTSFGKLKYPIPRSYFMLILLEKAGFQNLGFCGCEQNLRKSTTAPRAGLLFSRSDGG